MPVCFFIAYATLVILTGMGSAGLGGSLFRPGIDFGARFVKYLNIGITSLYFLGFPIIITIAKRVFYM